VEQRRFTRVESINFVNIEWTDERGQLTSAHVARTLDLSPGGVKIEITSSLPLSIPISGNLLVAITLGERILSLHGRIAHKRQEDERRVVVGIEFVDPRPEDCRDISDFLRG